VTFGRATVRGMVRSVKEDSSCSPVRWLITERTGAIRKVIGLRQDTVNIPRLTVSSRSLHADVRLVSMSRRRQPLIALQIIAEAGLVIGVLSGRKA
jgi:hypothetical protein